MNVSKQIIILLSLSGMMPFVRAQHPASYTVDADTLHLYHFNGDTQDAAGTIPLTLTGATITEASAAGFGTALDTYDGIAGGTRSAGGSANPYAISNFTGSDGAFTFEAIIRPDITLEALKALGSANHMQIICGEGDSTTTRGWHFRINNSGQLQFTKLAGTVEDVFKPAIPTTGDHAYAVGAWYHAAVTYSGAENTAGNLKLYWTKLDSGVTEAQLLGSFQMGADLTATVLTKFSIGNELRGASSENFEGLIDEVRISSIARAPSEMLYYSDVDTLHYYHFDGSGVDSIPTHPVHLTMGNGATVTDASLSGYGNALNTFDGVTGDGPNAAAAASNPIAISNFVGADGAFTFESFIKPVIPLGSSPNHMQIICGDSSAANSARGWHFRINSEGRLQFTKLTGSMEDFSAAVPTTGDQAYAANAWYHVAVTYNGIENTADNLTLYWTRMNSNAPQAQVLARFTLASDPDVAVKTNFAIGNELRGTFDENFEGLIDEVRISRIARAAGELLYAANSEIPLMRGHPKNLIISAGETAVFETVFSSVTFPLINWHRCAEPEDMLLCESDSAVTETLTYDPITETYTSTLTLDQCQVADSGRYYAGVSNVSGETVYSDIATLGVKGLRAHWTLDQADYTGTHYRDIVGGRDALVEFAPAFVVGADGTDNGAVHITPAGGWASLSGFDPAVLTGQFTLSYWVNWQKQGVAEDDFLMDSDNGALISVGDGLTANQTWQHVCAVFDGTTGRLYLDGVLAGVSEWSLPEDLTSSFYIGCDETGQERFDGYLDDMRIYSVALNELEAAELRYSFTGLRSCAAAYDRNCDWTGPEGISDCRVNLYDLVHFMVNYLSSEGDFDITGPLNQPDGNVNLYDFSQLGSSWLDCGLYPDCP